MLARQLPRIIAMHDVPDIEYLCAWFLIILVLGWTYYWLARLVEWLA
jgi:uncharacterized membrane protein (DUF373 family)